MTAVTREQVLDEFRGLLARVDEAVEHWWRADANTVIRTSPGLYLCREAGDAGDVYRVCGVLQASLWTPAAADMLAREVRDGQGNRGEPVHILVALRQERFDLARLIDGIAARA